MIGLTTILLAPVAEHTLVYLNSPNVGIAGLRSYSACIVALIEIVLPFPGGP